MDKNIQKPNAVAGQAIPCPCCGESIIIDPKLLLIGHGFACKKCQSSISLAPESTDLLRETLQKFDDLKKGKTEKKQEKNTRNFIF